MSVLNFICCITFKIFFILARFLKHPTPFFFSRLGLYLFDHVYNFILKFFFCFFLCATVNWTDKPQFVNSHSEDLFMNIRFNYSPLSKLVIRSLAEDCHWLTTGRVAGLAQISLTFFYCRTELRLTLDLLTDEKYYCQDEKQSGR